MGHRSLTLLVGVLVAQSAGCSRDLTSPSGSSNVIRFDVLNPSPGATIQTTGTPPGAFVEAGSDKLAFTLSAESESDEPIARVFIYGRDAGGITCAQNLPDAPDLGPLSGHTVRTVTVTGFQVFRLPCEVASWRAVLHRRASLNLNTEITAEELIAEQVLQARYIFR